MFPATCSDQEAENLAAKTALWSGRYWYIGQVCMGTAGAARADENSAAKANAVKFLGMDLLRFHEIHSR